MTDTSGALTPEQIAELKRRRAERSGVAVPAAEPSPQFQYERNMALETEAPDDAAYDLRKSQELGIPREAIAGAREEYRAEDMLRQMEVMRKEAPRTTAWMQEPTNYAIARDDTTTLNAIEKALIGYMEVGPLGGWKKSLAALGPSTEKTIAGVAYSSLNTPGLTPIDAALIAERDKIKGLDEAGKFAETVAAAVKTPTINTGGFRNPFKKNPLTAGRTDEAVNYAEKLLSEARTRAIENSRVAAIDAEDRFKEAMPKSMFGIPEVDAVYSGIHSAANMAPAMAAGFVTRSAGVPMAIMGRQVYGMETARGLEEGLDDGGLALFAGAHSGLERVTEFLGLKILFGGKPGQDIIKRGVASLLTEQVQEQVATATQDFVDWQVLNPEKTFDQFMAERPMAAYQTMIATLVASGATNTAVLTAEYAADQAARSQLETQPSAGEQTLSRLMNEASKSKLRTRAPDKFEDLATKQLEGTGAETTVIDLDGLAQSLEAAGLNIAETMADLGVPEDAISATAIIMGQVEVPTAKLLASSGLHAHADKIQPHIRPAGDPLTPAQKEVLSGETGAYVKSASEQIKELVAKDATVAEQRASIEEEVAKSLTDAGFSPQRTVIRANSILMSNMAVYGAKRRADERGEPIDIAGFWKENGPSIVSTFSGVGETAAPDVLRQAEEAGYQGRDRGEAESWVRAVEKGLDMGTEARLARAKEMGFDTETVLYHGTDKKFDAFRAGDRGIFLGDKETASTYGEPDAYYIRGELAPRSVLVQVKKEIKADRKKSFFGKLENERPAQQRELVKRLKAIGYAGYKQGMGIPGALGEVVIFDPANIRSVHAAFDPDQSASADLLAQPGYHGTQRDIVGVLQPSADGLFGPGIYLAKQEGKARAYAGETGQVLQMEVDETRLATYDQWKAARSAAGRATGPGQDRAANKMAVDQLAAEGFIGVDAGDTITVWNPADINPQSDDSLSQATMRDTIRPAATQAIRTAPPLPDKAALIEQAGVQVGFAEAVLADNQAAGVADAALRLRRLVEQEGRLPRNEFLGAWYGNIEALARALDDVSPAVAAGVRATLNTPLGRSVAAVLEDRGIRVIQPEQIGEPPMLLVNPAAYAGDMLFQSSPFVGDELNQLIGPKAKGADKAILNRAKQMAKERVRVGKGLLAKTKPKYTRQQIWDETAKLGQPWYQDQNGDWISEIEDGSIVVRDGKGPLSEVIEFPSIYAEYPQLTKMRGDARDKARVKRETGKEEPGGVGGWYQKSPFLFGAHVRVISRGGQAPYTATHEIQHAVDDIEGREMGRKKPYYSMDTERRAFNTMYRRLMTMEERIATPPWETEQEAVNWWGAQRDMNAPRAKFTPPGTPDPGATIEPPEQTMPKSRADENVTGRQESRDLAMPGEILRGTDYRDGGTRADRKVYAPPTALLGRTFLTVREMIRSAAKNERIAEVLSKASVSVADVRNAIEKDVRSIFEAHAEMQRERSDLDESEMWLYAAERADIRVLGEVGYAGELSEEIYELGLEAGKTERQIVDTFLEKFTSSAQNFDYAASSLAREIKPPRTRAEEEKEVKRVEAGLADKLFDMDKPLEGQPANVRAFFEDMIAEQQSREDLVDYDYAQPGYFDGMTVGALMRELAMAQSAESGIRDPMIAMIQRLRAAGIVGAKYVPGGIKEDGAPPSQSIVIFDERAPVLLTDQSGNLMQERRGGYSPSTGRITFTEARDLSTFMHETAHWFLDTLEKLAPTEAWAAADLAEIDAWYQSVRDTPKMAAIRARYAVTPTAGGFHVMYDGAALGPAYATEAEAVQRIEWRERQEAFAETFEQYLQTGKAPTPKLIEVFRAFRDWLVNLYRGMMPGERAALNPAIRDVFDRVLAVDTEVDAASAEAFRDADTMAKDMLAKGVITERQYRMVGERLNKAREEVKEEMIARALQEEMRQREDWWAKEKLRVKGDLARAFDKSEVGRAFNWLAYGEWKGDTEVQAEEAVVEEEYGALFQSGDWSDSGYMRVMPRDLFNEAKVLSMHLKFIDDYNNGRLPAGFEIEVLSDAPDVRLAETGELYLGSVSVTYNGTPITLTVPYNAGKTTKFPLSVTAEDMDVWTVPVFDETGALDSEFVEYFSAELASPRRTVPVGGMWDSAQKFMAQLGVVGLWEVDRRLPAGFAFDLTEPERGFQIESDGYRVYSANLAASLNGEEVTFYMNESDGSLMFESGDFGGPVLEGPRTMSREFAALIGSAGAADDSLSQSAPIFYSALSRFLQSNKTAKAPAAQWKGMIQNAPGIKAEEVEWTGVMEWLDLQDGPVTREALAAFVEANGVRVEEVVRAQGADANPRMDAIQREMLPLIEENDRLLREMDAFDDDTVPEAVALYERHTANAQRIQELRQERLDISSRNMDETKWSSFTLPGGENYREMLLTLPVEQKTMEQWRVRRGDGQSAGLFDSEASAQAWIDKNGTVPGFLTIEREKDAVLNTGYRSSHWSELNVLAHVRFKERTGPNGERVLALEEIQSDWHQAGRERGYALKTKEDFQQAGWQIEILDGVFYGVSKSGAQRYVLGGVTTEEQAFEQLALVASRGMPPNAPFKNNAWTELVLKRMIRFAAENGFDAVAWIPGNIQNGRVVETEDNRGDFYDKIVPNAANKIGKKFGAKVGRIDLGVGEFSLEKPIGVSLDSLNAQQDVWTVDVQRSDGSKGKHFEYFQTKEEAEEALVDLLAKYEAERAFFWTLPITPELRDAAINEGFPLFQSRTFNPPGHGPVTPPPNVPPVRLDLKIVKDLYGEEAVRKLPAAVRRRSSTSSNVTDMLAMIDTLRKTLAKKRKGPQTLTQFIMRRKATMADGTKEDRAWGIKGAAAELKAMGLEKLINEKSGRTLDYVREAAEEAGFIRPRAVDADISTQPGDLDTTLNDLLDALAREAKGEAVVRFEDEGANKELADARTWADWLSQNGVDIYETDKKKLRASVEAMLSNTDESLISPDQAAELFGFPNGEELLAALAQVGNRDKFLDEQADRALANEFGDMMKDGTLIEEAREAARLSILGRQSEIELEALSRAVGQQASTNYARQIARDIIALRTVKEIAAYERDLDNERRFSKQALTAVSKGDYATALKAKQRQIIAAQMYREGKKAHERIEKQRKDLLKYLTSESRRDKIANDYLERIDAVLDDYELRVSKQGPGVQKARQSAAAYVAWMTEQGREAEIAPEAMLLATQASLKTWRNLTAEEVDYLVGTIENLAHLGKTKQRLLNDKERREREAILDELEATLLAAPSAKTSREKSFTPTVGEGVAMWLRKAHARLTRMEFQFVRLDGREGGPLHSALFQPFADAADRETARMRDAAVRMQELYAIFTPAERNALFHRRIATPELKAPGKGLTLMDAVVIGLNWGNAGNRQALIDGYANLGWTADAVEAMLNRVLTDKHWTFIEGVWDLIGSYRADAFALEKSITGVAPKAVEGISFTLANGRKIEGKYYPLKYDSGQARADSVKQARLDEKQMLNEMGKSFSKPMTKTGHLIERVGSGGKPVKLSIGVFHEHVASVIHDIAYRRSIIDVYKLVTSPRFANAYIQAAGREQYDTLVPWIAQIANERKDEPGGYVTDLLRGARRNFSIMAMGLKVGTAVQQATGVLQGVPLIGTRYAAQGFFKALGGGPASFWSAWNWVSQKSEFMRDRPMGFDRDVREVTNKLQERTPLGAVRRNAFILIGVMDTAVSTGVWIGAYDKALDGNVPGLDKGDEEAAIAFADSIVRRSQVAGRMQDLPQMMRGTELEKLMTVVYSYFSGLYNETASEILRVRGGQLNPLAFSANMGLLYIVIPLVASALAGRLFADDDDDELEEKVAKELASNAVSTIPFARDVINATINPQFGYQLSPAGSIIEGGTKAAANIATGDGFETEYATKQTINLMGLLFGLPTGQLWITGEYVYGVATGEEDPAADPADAAREALLRDSR